MTTVMMVMMCSAAFCQLGCNGTGAGGNSWRLLFLLQAERMQSCAGDRTIRRSGVLQEPRRLHFLLLPGEQQHNSAGVEKRSEVQTRLERGCSSRQSAPQINSCQLNRCSFQFTAWSRLAFERTCELFMED